MPQAAALVARQFLIVIDEFTTVASVWTNAQFLNGAAIQGPALGLRIAAGNVANFADVETGGYGGPILGPLNSTQTPTMANFGTKIGQHAPARRLPTSPTQ